jgi:hypothetical protein
MAWTNEDLEKLEAAMAEGALRVKYKDKEIEYRSLREMERLREQMKAELEGKSKTVRVQASYDKGLC